MHTMWFGRVDCGSMRWSKGDDFENSSHLAPFLGASSSVFGFLECKKKPHYHTVHHLKSEWATLRGYITQTCVPCGLVSHYFLAGFLIVVYMKTDFCLHGDVITVSGNVATQYRGDIIKLNRVWSKTDS